MKRKILFCIWLVGIITVLKSPLIARQQIPNHKHLSSEDSVAVNALVLYPDTIRLDIFKVCEFPASVVSVATLQKNTSSDFANLISNYSKDEQEDYWNLSRYPDLVSKLVQGGEKSKEQIDAILADYPADIHDVALKYGRKHYDVLQKMDELQSNTNSQFEQILSDYPIETQRAMREIIKYPEIISLLNDHLSLAVRAGDHYRRDPQRVIQHADSLNLAEVRRNAEDAAAWKQNIEQNPDAQNDLKDAAKEYAKENGYSEDEIKAAPDSDYVSHYNCVPYSYWFGYPDWYPYSYWYPYPYWFDVGFYFDPFGNMIYLGLPSVYFTNWYFYYPEHWHRYPYLGNGYINFYYGRRMWADRNYEIVHNWVRENRSYLPRDFITDNSRRVEAIRQVGQMNVDVERQQGDRPVTREARDEYFNNNIGKYSALSNTRITSAEMQERQQMPSFREQPIRQPRVSFFNRELHATFRNPMGNAHFYNFNRINQAQQFHRDGWEHAEPSMRQMSPSRFSFPSGGGRRR